MSDIIKTNGYLTDKNGQVAEIVDAAARASAAENAGKIVELYEEIEKLKDKTVTETGEIISIKCDEDAPITVSGETTETVTLVHRGKNFVCITSPDSFGGVSVSANTDGSARVTGTVTAANGYVNFMSRANPTFLPGGCYVLSTNFVFTPGSYISIGDNKDGSVVVSINPSMGRNYVAFTIPDGGANVFAFLALKQGVTIDEDVWLQIEAGVSIPTDFEKGKWNDIQTTLPVTLSAYAKQNNIYTLGGDILTAETVKAGGIIDEELIDEKITEATRFDPTVWGLPVPYLSGNTTGMDKDNAVTLNYVFGLREGTNTLKWQGSSSLAHPEKNYTIVFDKAFEAKEGWGEQTKYVMKADWVDASHMLNILGALIWGQIVKRNGSGYPAASKALPNGGAIDGFPVLLVINDKLQGLYTFTIPKDGWLAGMTGLEGEFILNADGNNAACAFKEVPADDDSDFEAEYSASDETLAAGRATLATCVTDTINALATGENVDKPFENLNYDSALDYMVFSACLCNPDGITKNYQLFGRPELPLQFSAYDMDAILGNHWNGKSYYAPNYMTYASLANMHNIFKLIYTYKKEDLKKRHKLLRDTILNEANILTTATNYAVQIPSAVMAEDRKLWPGKPGTLTNDISRMMNFLRARLAIVDAEIEAL